MSQESVEIGQLGSGGSEDNGAAERRAIYLRSVAAGSTDEDPGRHTATSGPLTSPLDCFAAPDAKFSRASGCEAQPLRRPVGVAPAPPDHPPPPAAPNPRSTRQRVTPPRRVRRSTTITRKVPMTVRTTKTLRLVLFAALAVAATALVARRLSDSPPPAGERSTGAAGQYECPSALGGTYPPRSAYQDEFYGYADANVYPLGPWDPGGAGGVPAGPPSAAPARFAPTSPGPRFNRPPATIMSGACTTRWSPSSPEPQFGFNRSLSHRRPGHTPTPSHPGTRCTSLVSSCPFQAPTSPRGTTTSGRWSVATARAAPSGPITRASGAADARMGGRQRANLAANNPGYVSADRNRGSSRAATRSY